MSLGNLALYVIADTAAAKAGMLDFGSTARDSMTKSQQAVTDFQTQLQRSSSDLQAASQQIGSGMAAANDSIVSGSNASAQAVKKLADTTKTVDFDNVAARAKDAFTKTLDEIGPEARTKLQQIGSETESAVKGVAIGLAIGVVSATAAALYAGYRVISASVGFIKGLVTGESYKSTAIDSFAAINAKVVELQDSLLISSRQAGGLLDVFARLNVSKETYVSVFTDASKAMRDNGDELDRLGVKYRDQAGQLLSTEGFLTNVMAALDQYTEGYDRNAAAAAIGAGSYAAVNEALKANQVEIERSKDRLDEFVLAIGPQQQAELERYQQAMRDFNNEARLTGEGFRRAIADNIMPALTDLAEFFKDGFPTAVRAFRYTIAEVAALFYGLKTSVELVIDAIKGGFEGAGDILAGNIGALIKLAKGDLSGAIDSIKQGFSAAADAGRKAFAEMTADASKNLDRIKQGFGFDDRTDDSKRVLKGTKKFVPAPQPEDDVSTQARSAYAAFLQELDRLVTKTNESEYAMLRLKAAQLAAAEGIKDYSAAIKKVADYQRGESQNAVDAYVAKLKQETDLYAFQTSILELNSVQQQVATLAAQKRQDAEDRILQARKSGKPFDDQAIADIRAQTEATIALSTAQIQARDTLSRSGDFGATKALQDYQRAATDAAANTASFIEGAFSNLEDAIVQFANTGKLSLGGLFKFMADEFIRQETRMAISNIIGGGGLSFLGNILGAFGGGTGAATTVANALPGDPLDNFIGLLGTKHANGLSYVPYDNYPALLHKGEKVTSAQDAASDRSRAQGATFDFSGAQYSIGAGVSAPEVAQAVATGQAQTEARFRRLMKTGAL